MIIKMQFYIGDCQPCCRGYFWPEATLGLFSFVALGLFSTAALELFSQAALGLFSHAALGLFSFAYIDELGYPEEGFESLAALKKDLLAWLPRRGCYSFAAQIRMLKLGYPEEELIARLPRDCQLGFPRRELGIANLKSFKKKNTDFLFLMGML